MDIMGGDGGASNARCDGATERPGRSGSIGSACAAMFLAWFALPSETDRWSFEHFPNPLLEGEGAPGRLRTATFRSEAALPPELLKSDRFSLRMRSCLLIENPGRFVFRLTADNGARLTVDGALVVDAWQDSGRSVQGKHVELSRGNHALMLEYFGAGGPASLRLEMAEPGVHEFRSLHGRTELPLGGGQCQDF